MAVIPSERLLGDLLQGEYGTTIGHSRQVATMTSTAGVEIKIGTILQLDAATSVVTVPADAAALTNPVVYIGDDPFRNKKQDWDANSTVFTADNLTQKVVVMYRGYAAVGINKAALIYPVWADTQAEKDAINLQLDAKGFKLVRGVTFPAGY